jgi:hypothetical protein
MPRCNILTILIAREWRSKSGVYTFCRNIRPRARNQERQEIAPVKLWLIRKRQPMAAYRFGDLEDTLLQPGESGLTWISQT